MRTLELFSRIKSAYIKNVSCLVFVCVAMSSSLFSQCPESLGCNDNIQISLGYDCNACIVPAIILEDERDNCGYVVEIRTESDVVVATTEYDPLTLAPIYPCVDGSYIGNRWKASISFIDDNNTVVSCWGYFTVEDKLPPEITCIDDITIDCNDDITDLLTSTSDVCYAFEAEVDNGDPLSYSAEFCNASTTNFPNPWELVTGITTMGFTYTGSGSAQFNAGSELFNIIGSDITGDVIGTQVDMDGCITFTFDAATIPDIEDGEICVESSSFHAYQFADNCDPDLEVLITYDETQEGNCNDDITAIRTIRYYTSDNVGVSSEFCEFSIHFNKKDLGDIEFPDDFYTTCEDAPTNLDPANTGYPEIDGNPIIDEHNLCKINVTYSDDTFNLCGLSSLKILRRWTALDWCEGEYEQNFQNIKIEDLQPPLISCPQDSMVVIAQDNCEGFIDLDPLGNGNTSIVSGIDNCANIVSVTAEFLRADERDVNDVNQPFNPATSLGNNMFRASGLQGGANWLKYIVADDCGRSTECRFEIVVVNDNAPTPICDQYTVVSLDNSGWGRVYAPSVDDGSYDDCNAPVDLQIKRYDAPCSSSPDYVPNDLVYGDFVQFCCEEAGDSVLVSLLVTGPTGQSNSCDAYVVVQDKTGFGVTCPSQLVANLNCSQMNDIGTDRYGEATISDDCGAGTITHIDETDFDGQCGSGNTVRSWFLEFSGNTTELTQCEQTFYFTSDVTLTENSFVWPPNRDDATCENYTTDLGDAPTYAGVPVNEASFCGDLTYSYEDLVFIDVEGYCVKVIRTWTVIDWCLHNQNTGAGRWSRTQIIKVSNTSGPEFTNVPDDVTFDVTNDDCEQTVSFSAPGATDLCSNEVIPSDDISWAISGTTLTGFGDIPSTVLTVGTYTVTWSATGICGAPSVATHTIRINDTKAPVPYCKGGVTTVLMSSPNPGVDPVVTIWASDFDLGSSDNCSDVELSFVENTSQTNMSFTCDDLGINSVQIWVTDSSGNKDYCETTINIQANGGICDSIVTGMRIAGHIETELNEEVEGVEVSLQRMNDLSVSQDMTTEYGDFAFPTNFNNTDYQLTAKGQDDYLNGISTFDILMIQRHILGAAYLDSPYKIVAADVDNSETVTALDLIELRKLILGIYDELPDNESWRFISKSQTFSDLQNPWPIQEDINIYNLSSDMMANDFVAVKVGDVNGSVDLNFKNKDVDSRSLSRETLISESLEISSNGEYLIPFYFENLVSLHGIQLSLDFGNDVTISEVEAGKLRINATNFNVVDGQLNLIWHDNQHIQVGESEALFYVTIKTNNAFNDENIVLNSELIKSEIYTENFEIVNLDLGSVSESYANKLYQNSPNPFDRETDIEFDLGKEAPVELNIYDMNGQLVLKVSEYFPKGKNVINLKSKDLVGTGVYYYHLRSGSFSASNKMILVD